MATVYLAHDLRYDRLVALKVLHPEIAAAFGPERFLREIRLTARLQHPHILPVLDSGAVTGRGGELLWYTMPYVEGETLRHRLGRERQLGVEEALAIAREVADALDCAHQHGVVHRDVKPENILLTGGAPGDREPAGVRHALVADFGIAKVVAADVPEGGSGSPRLTETGIALGTPAYMSPEQATGDRMLDARTDVYALGCVLYEMLAGEPPYTGPTAQVIIAKRFSDPVPVVSRVREGIPRPVDAALLRALAKVPSDRFRSAGEFAAALGSGGPAFTAAAAAPTWRTRRLVIVVCSVLAIIAAAIFALHRSANTLSSREGPIALAVLPFQVLGAPTDSGILAVGIPDAIITRLAAARQLRLRPTSAILRYRDGVVDPQEVGKALAVDYLVTGTVQSAGDRLRISVQLLRVIDGTPFWGAHYDLPRQDLLTLQDSIAKRVSATLAVRMSAAEQTRLYRRYTKNAQAYEWYLRGRAELARVTEEGTAAAIVAFEHALALDSTYALARAGLSMASADMHLRFAKGAEVDAWGRRALAEAASALELDSTLAEAHLARAAVARKTDFDWTRTLEESSRALEFNPNLDLAHYFRAAAFYHLGLLDESEREVREALLVDPYNQIEQLRTRGILAFLRGDYPQAVTLLEDVRNRGSRLYADSYLSLAYYYAGDTLRALSLLDTLSRSPSAPAAARARSTLASFLAARGERSRAEALIDTVVAGGYMDHHVAFSIGAAFAQLGRLGDARTWLGRAVDTGFPCYPWFERDPLLQPIRQDSGSGGLLEGLKQSWKDARSKYSNDLTSVRTSSFSLGVTLAAALPPRPASHS
jgi:eukaryotic-like serine/threonine-protein kinase